MPACQRRRSACASFSRVRSRSPLATTKTRWLVSARPFDRRTSSRASVSLRRASRTSFSASCARCSTSARCASISLRWRSKSGATAAGAGSAAELDRDGCSRNRACAVASSARADASPALAAASSRRACCSDAWAASATLRALARSSSSSASRTPRGWARAPFPSWLFLRASTSFSRVSASCAERAFSSSPPRRCSARAASACFLASSASARKPATAEAADCHWNQNTIASTVAITAIRNAKPMCFSRKRGAQISRCNRWERAKD